MPSPPGDAAIRGPATTPASALSLEWSGVCSVPVVTGLSRRGISVPAQHPSLAASADPSPRFSPAPQAPFAIGHVKPDVPALASAMSRSRSYRCPVSFGDDDPLAKPRKTDPERTETAHRRGVSRGNPRPSSLIRLTANAATWDEQVAALSPLEGRAGGGAGKCSVTQTVRVCAGCGYGIRGAGC